MESTSFAIDNGADRDINLGAETVSEFNMASWTFTLLLLFYCNLTFGKDLILGKDCQGNDADCEEELQLNDCDCSFPQDWSGAVFSPNYPAPVTDFGTYKLKISSCDGAKIKLTIDDRKFNLVSGSNNFTVRDGGNFEADLIPPPLVGNSGDFSFPQNKPFQEYVSTGNELWITAGLFEGSPQFVINYTIIRSSLSCNFEEISGSFASPDFNETNYPSNLEVKYLIDVSAIMGDSDLLFTVQEFDLFGARGDYMKLAKGTDVEVQKDAAVFSWNLPFGYQFLINGPIANLVFKFMSPVSGGNSVHRGYSFSYQAINKTLTTPSPVTTPLPTSPAPLPFDPERLGTSLVFLDYVNNATASKNLVIVLEKYASSTNMLLEGEFKPELSESVIRMTKRDACYSGWNVNTATCVSAVVQVETFYYYNGSESASYAFPRETVEAAVRQYGGPQGIALPDSFLDLYWIAVVVAACVMGIIIIVFLISWRTKIRRQYNRRKEYLRGSGSSFGPGDGFGKPADSNDLGYVNNSFVYDEDDDHFGGPTYDPDRLKHHTRSHYGTNVPVSRNQSMKQNSARVPVERSNSLRFKVSSRDSSPRSSFETNKNGGISIPAQASHLVNAPKRGILKPSTQDNALDQVSSIVTLMDEPDDEILFDTQASFKAPTQPAQSTIPLQPVPVIDAQQYRHSYEQQDLRGVILDGYNSDDVGETNL